MKKHNPVSITLLGYTFLRLEKRVSLVAARGKRAYAGLWGSLELLEPLARCRMNMLAGLHLSEEFKL